MSQRENENENSNTLDKNERKKVKEALGDSEHECSRSCGCGGIVLTIPFLVTTTVHALNGFKQYCICYAISCRNGITGFGPVPRYTIMVERKANTGLAEISLLPAGE